MANRWRPHFVTRDSRPPPHKKVNFVRKGSTVTTGTVKYSDSRVFIGFHDEIGATMATELSYN